MDAIRVHRSGLHFGEEAIVLGNDQSGMVQLSGCHLACHFCYTKETSVLNLGRDFSILEFRKLVGELILSGAKNINLISPTHVWSQIQSSLESDAPLGVPLVLKVSGYESQTIAKSMSALGDVFVPDFKCVSETVASACGLPSNYGKVTQGAIRCWLSTHGDADYDASGKLRRGIVVRHLLMPQCLEDSRAVVNALAEIGFHGVLNLMTCFIGAKGLVRANPLEVRGVSDRALEAGMHVLVDGKRLNFVEKEMGHAS